MRLSPSQLQVWNECPQKWASSYRDGLKPKTKERKFDKGLYFHELLHVYYHTLELGYDPGSEFAINFMNSRMQNDMSNISVENIEIMSSIMPLVQKYVSRRSPKIDRGIKIKNIEHEFFVDYEGVTLHGIIDLVYDTPNGTIIRDHKSSEKANEWYSDKLYLNGQFLFYSLAHYVQTGEIPSVEVNFVCTYPYSPKNKKSDDELFKLFRHQHNAKAIEQFAANLVKIHDKMTNEEPHRVFGRACDSCAFKMLCHSETRGIDVSVALSGFDKKPKTD